MKIAMIGRAHAPTAAPMLRQDPAAAPPTAGYELRPGQLPPVDLRSPAGDLVRDRGRDLLAIPGAFSIGWRGGDDVAEVRLSFQDETGAALAKALLEPVVDGVRIAIAVRDVDGEYDGNQVPRTGDLVRSVAAMPGVWDYRYAETSPWTDGRVTFQAINREVVDRLDPLLRNRIPFGTTPDGRERVMYLHWRAGVPATVATSTPRGIAR